MWTLSCSAPSALWCSLSVPDSDMEGGNRKTVSWKGDGAGGVEEVQEYQVEEGNCTGRKVQEIEMQKRNAEEKMEEVRKRLQGLNEFHEQYEEHQAKLLEWLKTECH